MTRALTWLASALVAAFILAGVLAPLLGLQLEDGRPVGLDEPRIPRGR